MKAILLAKENTTNFVSLTILQFYNFGESNQKEIKGQKYIHNNVQTKMIKGHVHKHLNETDVCI